MNYGLLLILGGLLLVGFLLSRKSDDNISKEIKLEDNIKDKEK